MSREDFWSRRRAAVAEEEALEAAAPELEAAEVAALEDAELSDEELLEKYELPDPDSLKEGDDFTAFMAARVPERLRNRALRKLWLSNPAFGNLDGLVDYGEDYTDAATVIENMQTVYQVGKGMVQKILEVDEPEDALEELGDGELALAEREAEDPEEEIAEESEIPSDSVEIEEEAEELLVAQPEPEFSPAIDVKPRMRFHFSTNG